MLDIMKNLLILFFLLLFLCNFPDSLYANSTIKIGIYDNEPLIFVDADGRGKGFFAEILEYIGAKEEWKFLFLKK